MLVIEVAETDADLRRCFAVMHELRPHLDCETFLSQAKRQIATDKYRMAFASEGAEVLAVGGYRFIEMLAWGKAMYVDDLVTTSARRGSGCGSALFDWLVAQARAAGCAQFHLDSGVQRFGAHRFYLHKGMDIVGHHYSMDLTG